MSSLPFDPISFVELQKLAANIGTANNNITNAVNQIAAARNEIAAARDNVNTNDAANRENVKAHVSAAVATVGAMNRVWEVSGQGSWTATTVDGASYYFDVAISAVNQSKTILQPIVTANQYNGAMFATCYKLISASAVRCLVYGTNGGWQTMRYGFLVAEFK